MILNHNIANIIPLTELYDKYGNSINQSGQYIELNPTMRKITEKYKLNLNNPILKFSIFAKYIRKFILMFNNCNQLVMYGYMFYRFYCSTKGLFR